MGQQMNSGQVTADVTGSLNFGRPSGSTMVMRYNNVTNGTTTLYTVTAGKTLYIVSAWVFHKRVAVGSGGAAIKADYLGAGTVEIIQIPCEAGAAAPWPQTALSLNFNIPLEVPSGKTVTIYSSAANSECHGGFYGYEV